MDILDWIRLKRPGQILEIDDRLEITHASGEHSTIWRRCGDSPSTPLSELSFLYGKYDGMDLFSSTFKVAGLNEAKGTGGVAIVPSLRELAEDVSTTNAEFPGEAVPFMYQAGIGFYALGVRTGRIYEWDEEDNEVSGDYASVAALLDEWLEAVG
jgi:hypothetical protein